jgi:hypothetical protein
MMKDGDFKAVSSDPEVMERFKQHGYVEMTVNTVTCHDSMDVMGPPAYK